ncbi:MAG TPA: vitamin B12-dependent ribonucleotide reductase, partial [Kribbella sp.]|nr:vitamin B12-dependent ribonucleotide reductase [Kribbella sp.]
YVQKFTNLKFEPAGLTDDPDVRMAQSIMDYIFRRLALDYLPFDERAALGIYSADERSRQLDTGSYELAPVEVSEPESLKTVEPVADVTEAAEATETSAAAEKPADAAAARPVKGEAHTTAEMLELITGTSVDAPLCFTCGTKMRPSGSCYVCEGCGSTSGCS